MILCMLDSCTSCKLKFYPCDEVHLQINGNGRVEMSTSSSHNWCQPCMCLRWDDEEPVANWSKCDSLLMLVLIVIDDILSQQTCHWIHRHRWISTVLVGANVAITVLKVFNEMFIWFFSYFYTVQTSGHQMDTSFGPVEVGQGRR